MTNTRNLKNEKPPKYIIANGLAVGYLPEILVVTMPDGIVVRKKMIGRNEKGDIVLEHLTPVICATVAPVRPHAYVLAYNGGRHQSIKGNYQFFEADQSKIAGALNRVNPWIQYQTSTLCCVDL